MQKCRRRLRLSQVIGMSEEQPWPFPSSRSGLSRNCRRIVCRPCFLYTAPMPRPVTLFTGQWADLPLSVMAEKAASFGYDGVELACWGDHFEPGKALAAADYCKS